MSATPPWQGTSRLLISHGFRPPRTRFVVWFLHVGSWELCVKNRSILHHRKGSKCYVKKMATTGRNTVFPCVSFETNFSEMSINFTNYRFFYHWCLEVEMNVFKPCHDIVGPIMMSLMTSWLIMIQGCKLRDVILNWIFFIRTTLPWMT